MKTVIYKATEKNIEFCASLLRGGGLVAFPTETVYGLGANAFMPDSVKNIYAAKGRPSDNPLIVHVADKRDVLNVAEYVPEKAGAIIQKFMPGPVTVVLKKKKNIPDEVTGGLDTVAVRIPDNAFARELILRAGCPVCAPSANTSGKPSPTAAAHVFADLVGKIPAILDGGDCTVGVESTVIDFTSDSPRLLRAGGMPIEALEAEIGPVEVVRNSKVALCPGMKYKHYSPDADVYMAAPGVDVAERIAAFYDNVVADGKRAVIVCTDCLKILFKGKNVYSAGADCKEYAHRLFALLRRADDEKYDVVICEGVEESGFGASVCNRLTKASGGKTI